MDFPDYFKSELMETLMDLIITTPDSIFPDYFKSELMETFPKLQSGQFVPAKASFPDYFKSELMETLSALAGSETRPELSRLLQIGINGNPNPKLISSCVPFPITSNRN